MQMGCNQLCFKSLIRDKQQHIIMMLLTVAIPGGLGEGGYKFNTTHRWAPSGAPRARKASQLTAPYSFTFLVEPSFVHQERSFKDTKSEALFYPLAIFKVSIAWFDNNNKQNKSTRPRLSTELYSMGWRDCFGSVLSPCSRQPDLLLISTLLPYAAIWNTNS